jgi:hypothetical protein
MTATEATVRASVPVRQSALKSFLPVFLILRHFSWLLVGEGGWGLYVF